MIRYIIWHFYRTPYLRHASFWYDMPHSDVTCLILIWHASFSFTWFIPYDITHYLCMPPSCANRTDSLYMTWLISWMSAMTHSHLSHNCVMTHSYMCAMMVLIYKWVMAQIWMSHGTHMNESWHTYEWVMAHIWMSHIYSHIYIYDNMIALMHEWVMALIHAWAH